jgi:hypothetical protein
MLNQKIEDRTHLWDGLYYKEKTQKNKIILHHTAGLNINSAELWLRMSSSKAWRESKYYIGVHYYIGIQGEIIKTIPEEFWAWNTGTGNSSYDKSSISIEIENLGYLKPINDKTFIDIYQNRWNLVEQKNDIYTLTNGKNKIEVKKLDKEWRGYSFYHLYSDKAIQSLFSLMEEIFNNSMHKIERKIYRKELFFPEDVDWSLKTKILYFSGIITHVQLLGKKLKWDLSPVFPYEDMVKKFNLVVI